MENDCSIYFVLFIVWTQEQKYTITRVENNSAALERAHKTPLRVCIIPAVKL